MRMIRVFKVGLPSRISGNIRLCVRRYAATMMTHMSCKSTLNCVKNDPSMVTIQNKLLMIHYKPYGLTISGSWREEPEDQAIEALP
jgi:hypothetical protein